MLSPAKLNLNSLLILLELEKFPDSPADHNQGVKEMFVCFGGVQFLPQAKLSWSPQQLRNRKQTLYFFFRNCCFYLQTNRNLFGTFTAEPLPLLLRPASPVLFFLLLHLHLLNNKQQFKRLLFKVRDNWNSDFQTLKYPVRTSVPLSGPTTILECLTSSKGQKGHHQSSHLFSTFAPIFKMWFCFCHFGVLIVGWSENIGCLF